MLDPNNIDEAIDDLMIALNRIDRKIKPDSDADSDLGEDDESLRELRPDLEIKPFEFSDLDIE